MVASYLENVLILEGTEFIISATNGEGTKFVGQDFTCDQYTKPTIGLNHIKYETVNKVTIVSLDYKDANFRNKTNIKVTVNGVTQIIPFVAVIDNHDNKRINFQISGDVFDLASKIGTLIDFKIELI